MWSNEFPTEPGYYFCYGYRSEFSKRNGSSKEFMFVKVTKNDHSTIYIANGHFIFKGEAVDCVWQPAQIPELPQ